MILILDDCRLILIKTRVIDKNSAVNAVSEYIDAGNGISRNLLSDKTKIGVFENPYDLVVLYFLSSMEDNLEEYSKKEIIKEFRNWIRKDLLHLNNFFYEIRYNYVMNIEEKELNFLKFLFMFDYNPKGAPQKINLSEFNESKGIKLSEYFSMKCLRIINKMFNSKFLFGQYKKCTNPNEIEDSN